MKRDRLTVTWGLWFVLAVMLAGCATVAPQTPAQRLAMIDGQVTALYNTAADLREGGVIDDEQARDLQSLFLQVNTALDAGWAALAVGDLTQTENQIRLLNKVLWELRDRLQKVE